MIYSGSLSGGQADSPLTVCVAAALQKRDSRGGDYEGAGKEGAPVAECDDEA